MNITIPCPRWKMIASRGAAVAGLFGVACLPLQAQTPSAPIALSLPSQPPPGAVVLFAGKGSDLTTNWYKRYSTTPATWTVDADGAATPAKSDITSRQEFGDCYVHVEFRCAVDATGKEIGHGNSGVGLLGRYEVQILGDYGKPAESHGSGAFYSLKAPMVNAAKKPGEWQTYDIIFRAPRLDDKNQVTEKPRATVFLNGVLVQNNEEFPGMTGIQYSQYKEPAKTGPIILQGDHDPVQFRNVWVLPM